MVGFNKVWITFGDLFPKDRILESQEPLVLRKTSAGFEDAKEVLARSFRDSVHLLRREDGSYGNFGGWTWYIEGDSDSEWKAFRDLILGGEPSKKVVMPNYMLKKHFDESLGVLRPHLKLARTLDVFLKVLSICASWAGPTFQHVICNKSMVKFSSKRSQALPDLRIAHVALSPSDVNAAHFWQLLNLGAYRGQEEDLPQLVGKLKIRARRWDQRTQQIQQISAPCGEHCVLTGDDSDLGYGSCTQKQCLFGLFGLFISPFLVKIHAYTSIFAEHFPSLVDEIHLFCWSNPFFRC